MGHERLRRFVIGGILWGAIAAARAQDAMAAVHGRAIDANGKPMAGCAVGLFDLGEVFDTKALLAKPATVTDGDGRYALQAKREDHHLVVVVGRGHQVCVQQLPAAPDPVRHLPDSLMLPGTTLRGRVRDSAGRPIAGAKVRVADPLTAGRSTMTWFASAACTDDQGIFEVPGVPRTGLAVSVTSPGFAADSRLAAHDSPLDFTLVPTGLVRGRVVDADGKPAAGIQVHAVTVEHLAFEPVVSDAAGCFALTLPRATRFRVAAQETRAPHRCGSSGLLRGAADELVVQVRSPVQQAAREVTVRCIDAATRAPIEQFHASSHLMGAAQRGAAYMRHQQARTPYRGQARLAVPTTTWDRSTGSIMVDAPGHAFVIVPIPADGPEPLVVELPPEAVLVGQVIDAETGKPAVGAAVRAMPRPGVSGAGPDPFQFGAITDDDGRYRIPGLAEEAYDVQVYAPHRQASRSSPITVSAPSTAFDLEAPKANYLEFELVGDVPEGCLGSIEWGGLSHYASRISMLEAPLPPLAPLPLTGALRLKVGPVAYADHRAILHLPARDRLGSGGQTIDLGLVAGKRRIQLPDLRQTMHHGRVHLPPEVPTQRVALLATRVGAAGGDDSFAGPFGQPAAVCLGSDGRFLIDLPPGRYALQLADLETGLIFHTEEDDRELGEAPSEPPIELRPALRWLEVRFEPTTRGGEVVLQAVTFDAMRARRGRLPALLAANRLHDLREQGSWLYRAGTTQVRWLVGDGELQLSAVRTFEMLAPTSTGYQGKPVDTVTIDPTDPRPQVTLRIPPPPSDAEILGGTTK